MSTKEQIAEALHINTTNTVDPKSRLIICIKKNICFIIKEKCICLCFY